MVLLLAGRAERSESAPVERAQGRNELEAATIGMTPTPRELERCLVGLGAGVREEYPSVAKGLADSGCQPRHRFGVKHVARVGQLLGLLLNRADDARMPMAEARHRESAKEVKIAVTIGIVEVSSMAARESKRHTPVGVDQVGMSQFDNFRVVHG